MLLARAALRNPRTRDCMVCTIIEYPEVEVEDEVTQTTLCLGESLIRLRVQFDITRRMHSFASMKWLVPVTQWRDPLISE